MKTFNQFTEAEKTQTVTLTTSCLIRLLEYVREDVKDDSTLHKIVEAMSECNGVIEMDCYEDIIKGLE